MMTTTAESAVQDPSSFLAQELASTWQWRIDTDPELAASLGLLSHRRSTHALDPRSAQSFEQRLLWVQKALERIQCGLPPDQAAKHLSEEELLSYQLYVLELTNYVKNSSKHKAYLCCVNRLEGPQTDLALYARYLPLKTQKEREFYRDFLKAIPVQLQQVQELLTIGLEQGRTPPNVSLNGVVEQIRGMVSGKLEAFSKPIQDCFHLPSEENLKNECEALLQGPVPDAFTAFGNYLETDYVPHLRTEISATKGYPDGVQYYADCLAFHTTTSMTPAEVHQLGLDEVKRVRTAMEDIAAQAGYAGRLEEYMNHLRTSPDYEPTSGPELLAHYRDITGRIHPAMLKLFHWTTMPRMPFDIVETPAAHAAMAPAAYYLAGSTDRQAPRPGIFYVNTSELPTRRTYECEALALHESIPGHHTQFSVQNENLSLPDFRRFTEDRRYFEAPSRFPFYTAYAEGWGLHAETLGKDLGLYKRLEDQMGQLSMEALRSCRLVVDSGMHALDWTFDQALQYMLDNTAMGEHDARTEVARYITWPGQATAYKVGERFLHKLRTKAETTLQETFDPRDFYDIILRCGPVPLNVLEEKIDQYLRPSTNTSDSNNTISASSDQTSAGIPNLEKSLAETLTFVNWCKCCVVPGACQV